MTRLRAPTLFLAGGGLIAFGIANAYVASPFDTTSGKACGAQGETSASCQVTTTSPDDMLIGLVASYGGNGHAILPGSGFKQIQQEEVGPYAMAEFYNTGAAPGTQTISASNAYVTGMAVIGDAVRLAGYVGWVSPLVSNASLLDQVGTSSFSTAPVVSPNAICDSFYAAGSEPNQGLGVTTGPYNLTGVSASSAGYYQLPLPDIVSYTVGYFTGGAKGHEVTDNIVTTLSDGGTCASTINGQAYASFSNPSIHLYSSTRGYWNSTVWVSSTLSPSNDYQQFGLPPVGETYSVISAAFVHTSYAMCGVTVGTSVTQTVQSDLAGNGFTRTNTSKVSISANPESDGVSEVDYHYYESGTLNQSGTPQIANSYVIGNPFNPSGNAISPQDPYPSAPTGSWVITVGGSGLWLNNSTGGQYTSSSGLDVQIGIEGGWTSPFGISVTGGFAAELKATTSLTQTSAKSIECELTDPEAAEGEDTQYYIYADGSEVLSQYVVNMHVWLDDYCVPANPPSTCN